jgi:phosphatidylinositol glycan class C protein
MANPPPVPPSPQRENRADSISSVASTPATAAAAARIPPPVPVETHPNRAGGLKPRPPQDQHHHHQQSRHDRPVPDPGRLAPEHAYYAQSPPRLRQVNALHPAGTNHAASLRVPSAAAVAALRPPPAVPGLESKPGKENWASSRAGSTSGGGRRRRRKRQWKKLLWVKQSCEC